MVQRSLPGQWGLLASSSSCLTMDSRVQQPQWPGSKCWSFHSFCIKLFGQNYIYASQWEALLPRCNSCGDRYHYKTPLSICSSVVYAAFAVLFITLVIEVAWLLDQLPCHAGVMWVLEQHRLMEGEGLAAANVDLKREMGGVELILQLIGA